MNLVEELSAAEHLPLDALRAAVRTPDRVAAGVLRVLDKAASGETLTPREANLLFWGIHVLAQARDTRLFGPLLALLRRPPDEIEPLLGDALASTLGRMLASTYDGNAETLTSALLDPATDEYGRWALFNALATLVVGGSISREVANATAGRFEAERPSPAGEPGWIGWAELVAICGFGDLAAGVERAFATGFLLDDQVEPSWFADTLAAAQAARLTIYELDPMQFGFVEDAVAELEEALADDGEESEPLEPVTNPLRHVGRNDPCPCGSGRKFKTCCLSKVGDGTPGPRSTPVARKDGPPFMPPLPPMRGR